ncbi:ABC transporter permease [Flindersiella endophytica]
MFGYIAGRVASGTVVLLMIAVSTFALFILGPADPAAAMCGDANCPPERYTRIRHSLNLDRPIVEQFAEYMGGIVTGRELRAGAWVKPCPAPCFGYSFRRDRPVTEIMLEHLPVTVSIALGGALICVVAGVLIGTCAAIYRGTFIDKGVVALSLLFGSIPYYVFAVTAFLFLAVQHPIFPRTGYQPLLEKGPIAWASGLLLAWIVLGLTRSIDYSRYVRSAMVEALEEDFIRTARAKGLPPWKVNIRHGLRAGLAPIATIFGLDLAGYFSGSVFTERIFDLKGLGAVALDAERTFDLPVIMGTVLYTTMLIVVANLLTDLAYGWIDPRVRVSQNS